MTHAGLLALLLPAESYNPAASPLQQELWAEGNSLDVALAYAKKVEGAITPFFAGELLSDWERVCGITATPGAPYQVRLQAVLAKLAETGGLSIPYFTRLAGGLGYIITIDEPQPFRAGSSRAGQRIAAFDVIWVWRVNVAGGAVRTYRFRAGMSRAGERLAYAADPVIENVFNELKPAHTLAVFSYQE